jgi:hypothetical protein
MRYGYSFRLIKLSKGKFAKVGQADFLRLRKYAWITAGDTGRGYTLYAQRTIISGKVRRTKMMHRDVMDAMLGPDVKLSRGKYVDHINGDGLDNRRANLRAVTPTQNNWNRRFRKTGSSKYTGCRGTRGVISGGLIFTKITEKFFSVISTMKKKRQGPLMLRRRKGEANMPLRIFLKF